MKEECICSVRFRYKTTEVFPYIQSPAHSANDQMSKADVDDCHDLLLLLHLPPDHPPPILHHGEPHVDLSSAAPGLVLRVPSSAIS